MLRALPRDLKKCGTNSVPQVDVMCDGTPCLEKTWSMNSWVSCIEVIVSWVGIKIACLESRSMTTRMAVNPSEGGNCSMKSMEIEFYGFSGIGSCWRLPYGQCCGALDLAQVVQDLQWSLMYIQTPGQV